MNIKDYTICGICHDLYYKTMPSERCGACWYYNEDTNKHKLYDFVKEERKCKKLGIKFDHEAYIKKQVKKNGKIGERK